MKILTFPHDILRKPAAEFDFKNPIMDPLVLEKELVETMVANKGLGLAANQVGICTRVFVTKSVNYPEQIQAYFNPIVVDSATDLNDLPEGCLSFPNVYVKIKRPVRILARWQNAQGAWNEGELGGYDCVCFLHELDHLEGIVFQDRVSPLKWNLATIKAKKGNQSNVRAR